ncbi:hypothetical protein [Bacillus thermotolerans]|uniref:Uncharacterized protein n=1 Tax=Bacillus thermotolerans TaxID=1221996 RepID=A0A0F5HNF2_BACTR|nr:hypothetical protein [Bacillus thermotolerans]KKB33322.1 hypothetical protein QY96_00602 [Bacillus thermotolerans]KKB34545.1 hypothetical protein QY97_02273 [Bacillus thermotolerans]KKB43429.1 hypothetical protein QY95_01674 [Bacillus thermotolerans]
MKKVMNVTLQYDSDKIKGDFTETLNKLVKNEGMEVVSVGEAGNTNYEQPYDRRKKADQALPDVGTSGAGGMVSPN